MIPSDLKFKGNKGPPQKNLFCPCLTTPRHSPGASNVTGFLRILPSTLCKYTKKQIDSFSLLSVFSHMLASHLVLCTCFLKDVVIYLSNCFESWLQHVASAVVMCGLSSPGAWDLTSPEIKLASFASEGNFLPTGPPGPAPCLFFTGKYSLGTLLFCHVEYHWPMVF